jgi:hypothetical protein
MKGKEVKIFCGGLTDGSWVWLFPELGKPWQGKDGLISDCPANV